MKDTSEQDPNTCNICGAEPEDRNSSYCDDCALDCWPDEAAATMRADHAKLLQRMRRAGFPREARLYGAQHGAACPNKDGTRPRARFV